jgi:hypothetical protein
MRPSLTQALTTLQIAVAIIELLAWLPLSGMGLTFTAAYVVAGNPTPPTLIWGFFFVPVTFVAAPVYALIPHGRAHPKVAFAVLAMPLVVLAITYASELPSLTHHPS